MAPATWRAGLLTSFAAGAGEKTSGVDNGLQREGSDSNGAEEGNGFLHRQPILTAAPVRNVFSFSFRRGVVLPWEEARKQLDNRVQSTMLVVRQTAAFQPRMWFTGDLVLEHLYQATLADAGLPTEHHDLALALFGVCPAFQQQRHLGFPANQRGQAAGAAISSRLGRHRHAARETRPSAPPGRAATVPLTRRSRNSPGSADT